MMSAHAWKRELLLHRIRDFNSVGFVADGVRYYGAPDARSGVLLKRAIYYHEGDQLTLCERCIALAERAQILGINRHDHAC
jgi:hypothetical protein